jgi:hypothetical protein
MIFLPRIARALHHPGIAAFLGIVLISIGIYGLASGDIPKLWAILVIVIGSINVMRLIRQPESVTREDAQASSAAANDNA